MSSFVRRSDEDSSLTEDESNEIIEKIVNFYDKLNDKGLLSKSTDQTEIWRKLKTRAKTFGLYAITCKKFTLAQIQDPKIASSKEMNAFSLQCVVDGLRYSTQELIQSFKSILDESKFSKFDSNELGSLFAEILDKAGIVDRDERQKLYSFFKIDLRNALAHNDYEIDLESSKITWYDKNGKPNTLEDDVKTINEVELIIHTTSEYWDSI